MFFTRLFIFVAVLGIAVSATAESITTSGSYDGSYDPYSAGWDHGTAMILPVANSPEAGLADFTDANVSSTGGGLRVQMSQSLGAGVFSDDQSDDIFTITARLKLGSSGIISSDFSNVLNIGLYSESSGTTSGKVIQLGFIRSNSADGNQPGLWICPNGSSNPSEGAFKMTNANYFDDQWHIFTLDKYLDQDGAKVRVLVDGVQVGNEVAYSSLTDSPWPTEGIGYFGSTPCAGQVTLDYLEYSVTTDATAVPEPTTIASLAMLLVGFAVCGWRKRK